MPHQLLKIWIGCFIVSLSVYCFTQSGIITGGTVGLSLSVSYLLGVQFSWTYFFVNLPFYILSFLVMGKAFSYKTIFSVISLSIFSYLLEMLPAIPMSIWIGAILGGLLLGIGMTYIFKQGASLGGVNILALYWQKKYQWNVGITMFIMDSCILLTALIYTNIGVLLVSAVSLLICSMILSKHKKTAATPAKVAPVVVASHHA